jgi:poly(beta-D-mannuronate) lyase
MKNTKLTAWPGVIAAVAAMIMGLNQAVAATAKSGKQKSQSLMFHLPVAQSAASQLAFVDCGKWPKPVVMLATQTRYNTNDKSRTNIDEDASEEYERLIAPVRQLSRSVVEFGNRFVLSGGADTKSAYCAGQGLALWAKGNALTIATTDVANFNRATFLGAVSSAYIQIKQSKQISSSDNTVIRNWLKRLSSETRSFYQKKRDSLSVKPNNIQFWAALGVANASVALNDRSGFKWAMTGFELGVCTITPEGAIPREVDRKSLALHYHTFALQPLVSLAELAERNGYDGYAACDGKLQTAVDFTLQQIDNPSALAALANAKQKSIGELKSNNDLAWLELYAKRFPEFPWAARMDALRPFSNTNIGGDLTELLKLP